MKRSPDMRRFVPDLAKVIEETDPERLAEQRKYGPAPDEAREHTGPEPLATPQSRSTLEMARVKVTDDRTRPTVEIKRGPWERAAADARAAHMERELAAPPLTAETAHGTSDSKKKRLWIAAGVALVGALIAALSLWAGRARETNASPNASASASPSAAPSTSTSARPNAPSAPMPSATTMPSATMMPTSTAIATSTSSTSATVTPKRSPAPQEPAPSATPSAIPSEQPSPPPTPSQRSPMLPGGDNTEF